ncbi:hypothetical protein KL86SPO_31213 [uncultured Sporomusa sp.]|uniref:Uncharacterized protein n=1 Tax=uncultured Sporomusa sp. TaxID=307249 RepID=A0A212LTV3_9FIRM|nr:hypothetical protein KL86SPO_31213 [uncultured Sporomusa sp.]
MTGRYSQIAGKKNSIFKEDKKGSCLICMNLAGALGVCGKYYKVSNKVLYLSPG